MSACAVSRTVGSFLLLKAAACAVTASRGRQRGKRSSKCMRNPRSYARSLWVQAQVCVEGARGRGEPWNCRGALARLDESPRCHHPIDKHMASCSRKHSTSTHPPTARARRVTSVNIDLHVLHDPYDSHKFGGETPRATSLPAPTTCTPPPPSWTGSICQFQWRHTRPHTSSTTSPSSSYLAWGPRPSSSHPHQCTMCSPGGRAPGPAPR